MDYKQYIEKSDFHGLNKYLENNSLTFHELCSVISEASDNPQYTISIPIYNKLNKYVQADKYGNIWESLTNLQDYNFHQFQKRIFPYFNLECKEWVKANMEAKGDYPHVDQHDMANPQNRANEQNNTNETNYSVWDVLEISRYSDIEKYELQGKTLVKIGLHSLAVRLFCNLMLSPYDCHIIKSRVFWNIAKPIMEKNNQMKILLNYCLYYAMYIMRQEETLLNSRVNPATRVLFTLREASNLPVHTGHIERSPYIQQLVGGRLHMHVPFYITGGRRICTEEEFVERFDIATAGAFRGIDMQELKASVTGSILVPCVHVSPLEQVFDTLNIKMHFMTVPLKTQKQKSFARYLEYYYPGYASLNSDDYTRDVLTPHSTVASSATHIETDLTYEQDGWDNSIDMENLAQQNEQTTNTADDVRDIIALETGKPDITDIPLVNKTEKKIEYNQLADIDVSITANDSADFHRLVHILYEKIRQNCKDRGEVYAKRIKTLSGNIKYNLYGPGLSRPIDIFSIPYHPCKMVKKFHMPVVRMYYNNSVYMFRACIAALMSGVNDSYKWFSCNKIPIDVILKYAQRGISTIFNTREKNAASAFIAGDKRWGDLLRHFDIQETKIYSAVKADHPFFRFSQVPVGIRVGLKHIELPYNVNFIHSTPVETPPQVFRYGRLAIKSTEALFPPDITAVNEFMRKYQDDEDENRESDDDVEYLTDEIYESGSDME